MVSTSTTAQAADTKRTLQVKSWIAHRGTVRVAPSALGLNKAG